jgi:hypothetical protein
MAQRLIWINAIDCICYPNSIHAEGGLDASLTQSSLVDFQSVERLESSLLGLSRF